MSEERPQHTQEPAEGADEDVQAPGAEKAGGEQGNAGGEGLPSRHPQEAAEGDDEDVGAPGAEGAGGGS